MKFVGHSFGCGSLPLKADTGGDGKPTLDLTWNGLYQLVSVSTNGVFAEGYAYDALGLVPKQNMDRYDFVVRTSKEIDAKIINAIEEFKKSKPNYGVSRNNCAQSIRRILIKGGLGDIPFCILPNGLLESLRNRGRFNIFEANRGNLYFCPLR